MPAPGQTAKKPPTAEQRAFHEFTIRKSGSVLQGSIDADVREPTFRRRFFCARGTPISHETYTKLVAYGAKPEWIV